MVFAHTGHLVRNMIKKSEEKKMNKTELQVKVTELEKKVEGYEHAEYLQKLADDGQDTWCKKFITLKKKYESSQEQLSKYQSECSKLRVFYNNIANVSGKLARNVSQAEFYIKLNDPEDKNKTLVSLRNELFNSSTLIMLEVDKIS